MKNFKQYFNEAAFSEKNLLKVVKLYGKLFGKKLGNSKLLNKIPEKFKRSRGDGKGYRVAFDGGAMVRFNYEQVLDRTGQFGLTSIDIWDKSKDFTTPDRTLVFNSQDNVIDIAKSLSKDLLSGKTGVFSHTLDESYDVISQIEFNSIKLDESDLDYYIEMIESKPYDKRRSFLLSKGLKVSRAKSVDKTIQAVTDAGLLNEYEIFMGSTETNSLETGIKKNEKLLTSNEDLVEVYSDPKYVFSDIASLTEVVAKKKWKSFALVGDAGVGKTFIVRKKCEEILGGEGKNWVYTSGTKAAPYSLYKTLFESRDKLIVFDEADSMLKNPDIIVMLKAILDTSGDNLAAYMSGTKNMTNASVAEANAYAEFVDEEIAQGKAIGMGKNDVKLPSKFSFTGQMIFITNMPAAKMDDAIMSRSIFLDVHLYNADVLNRIRAIGEKLIENNPELSVNDLDRIMKNLGADLGEKDHDVQYMTPQYARKNKTLTVRALQIAMMFETAGFDEKTASRLTALYS